jgi:hypothetical protein
MNRDDIIRMAREAGFQEYLMRVYRAEEGVHHFAALVAAFERESCCRIVTGLCISDNNAREINEAIRGQAWPSS